MTKFKITRLEIGSDADFMFHEYRYACGEDHGYLAFVLLRYSEAGVFVPIDRDPVLSLLHVAGLKLERLGMFSDSQLKVEGINGEGLDFEDLEGVNFGYVGESYRDIGHVFELARERRIVVPSDGILVLAGADTSCLDDRIKKIIEPEVAA